MNIKSNLIIFSTDSEKRIDIRKLKEKKLQVALNSDNNLPIININDKEYIKTTVCNEIEKMFGTPIFYVEQLYTWGDPKYYTKEHELLVTYLVIINKNNIKQMPKDLYFYDIVIENKRQRTQKIILNGNKKMEYEIETIVSRERDSIEYSNKLISKSQISELTAIIIHTGIKRLRNRIENTNIAFSFLDKEFTISELQQIYEIILDKKLTAPNFRKKVDPMLKKTEIVVKDSAYRPSKKYTFNEEFIEYWV